MDTMKVYIPFNSNDFNSVFTTLSISPASFYPLRDFSFKRSCLTTINENPDYIVGLRAPVFPNTIFDKDGGYLLYLEIEMNELGSDSLKTGPGIDYVVLGNTLFLFRDYQIIFRNEEQLAETFAKTLKSIETKYAKIAKDKSHIWSEPCASAIPSGLNYPPHNPHLAEATFKWERTLNRALGVILGSSVGVVNTVSPEWQYIGTLLREVENNTGLYLNKNVFEADYERSRVIDLLGEIERKLEEIEPLDDVWARFLDIEYLFLEQLKEKDKSGIPFLNALLTGFRYQGITDIPFGLAIQYFSGVLSSSKYVKEISSTFEEVSLWVRRLSASYAKEIDQVRSAKWLGKDNIIRASAVEGAIEWQLPQMASKRESDYLLFALEYFVDNDRIKNSDDFFVNRKAILAGLGLHYKEKIHDFGSSEERTYLISLDKSFGSLRSGFNVSQIDNDVVKVLAVLFTTGRELSLLVDNCRKENITDPVIYYSLWGAIYGASDVPKTLTQSIVEIDRNMEILLSAFEDVTAAFTICHDNRKVAAGISDETALERIAQERQEQKQSRLGAESESKCEDPVAEMSRVILEMVERRGSVPLTEIKNESPKFRTNKDVENFIVKEMNDSVVVKKEGRKMVATLRVGQKRGAQTQEELHFPS